MTKSTLRTIMLVLTALCIAPAIVDAFQVETSVVDWMTYAREHDLWRSQHQKDIDQHHLRPPASPDDGLELADLGHLQRYYPSRDRTWRFPQRSQIMEQHRQVQSVHLPPDLSFDDRMFQSKNSPTSFQRRHEGNEAFLDNERMWMTARPSSRAFTLDPTKGARLPDRLSDEDQAFWFKNKDPELYRHLLLE